MPRGPMPNAPKRWVRDFTKHGHHKECELGDVDMDSDNDYPTCCTCRELDNGDYENACEARYDAWKDGDYDE